MRALWAVILALAAFPAYAGQEARLVVFWRSDCAPCAQEMRVLPVIAAEHPDMAIALVALDGGAPPPMPANVEVMRGEGLAMMRRFGNDRRALPYSVMLHGDGSVCARHYGVLGTDSVSEWVKSC